MLQDSSNAKIKQFLNIFPRRFGISKYERIHLHGAPKSGKTCIALNYIRDFKNPFYIDFNDIRNSPDLIKNYLLKISMEKKVSILVLDNIPNDWSNFPNLGNIITISEHKSTNLDFVNKEILPLNFEEFIGFDALNQNINQLLDSFIKYGNLPYILNIKDSIKLESKQNILSLVFKNNMDIFILLCQFQGQLATINQIYSLVKKQHKTSKDSIYSLIKDWQNRGILYFVENFTRPNLPKKIFFWDFSIRSALSYEKNFISIIENMVFLELLAFNKPIFYGNKINLICNGIGYIIAVFNTMESIKELVSKIDLMGLDIIVLTFELEGTIRLKNKEILIRNFINFALDE